MAGAELGALHGLPLSVKDLISMADVPWTFGSKPFAENIGPVDAPSVERARAAGACIIGKTTTSEFGCKDTGDSPLTGITRNPWNVAKTPGGSSAGAGASVAAGLTPFALGTDGGGSVRIPSSLCGLFGIKAQFSRVPLFPVPATPTLAHVGPLARTVRDAALLLGVISGHDRRDPFAVAGPVPDYLAACGQSVKGMRIAWSPTFGYARSDPEVLQITEQAARTFEQLGCTVDLVEAPLGDSLPLQSNLDGTEDEFQIHVLRAGVPAPQPAKDRANEEHGDNDAGPEGQEQQVVGGVKDGAQNVELTPGQIEEDGWVSSHADQWQGEKETDEGVRDSAAQAPQPPLGGLGMDVLAVAICREAVQQVLFRRYLEHGSAPVGRSAGGPGLHRSDAGAGQISPPAGARV